jgi:hypothetical protein
MDLSFGSAGGGIPRLGGSNPRTPSKEPNPKVSNPAPPPPVDRDAGALCGRARTPPRTLAA